MTPHACGWPSTKGRCGKPARFKVWTPGRTLIRYVCSNHLSYATSRLWHWKSI